MDYKEKYNKLVEAVKVLQETNPSDEGIRNWVNDNVPELRESKDEKTRKEIVGYLKKNLRYEWATWLEKQGTSYTKRDVDDAYIEGMAFAKDELEKQGGQKHALDIEIPFGAKDSELQEATYLIPEGFHAEIEGDKVVIKKGKQKPAWTESDDEELEIAINALKGAGEYSSADWLLTLKQRIL